MAKYRKNPVVIEAIRFTEETLFELGQFMGEKGYWAEDGTITVYTLEGTMRANPGDWIIKGVKGEYYPCKPDIFKETYEEVK